MKPIIKRTKIREREVFVLLFLVSFFIYFVSSNGNTPYNYFTRLADAFLHGRLYLTNPPPWLSELLPRGNNTFWVVYPPFPAILSIPFVAIFGINFPQQYIAHILASLTVCLTYAISLTIKKDYKLALWSALLVGVGSIVWFMASSGSVWYTGQLSAAFFLTSALYESQTKKRSFLIGFCLGAAYLSRVHTILSLPFFIYLARNEFFKLKHFNFPNITKLLLGLLPFVLFNMAYNFVRFGVPWDQAYFLLPAVLNETNAPWFVHGVMNIVYIPDNIKAAFWTFPKVLTAPPFIEPSLYSLAIWITTPAFVFSLFAPIKEWTTRLCWATIIILFLFVAMHGGTGWAQFGYRFAVDFYPFLIFLTIKGVAKQKLRWYHWVFLFIGIGVNLWGVVWINKFNWVSF